MQVRIEGRPPASKSFMKKAQAEAWARTTEDALRGGGTWNDTRGSERVTVGSILERYAEHITPRKKSAASEMSRLRMLSARLGSLSVAALTPEEVIRYVDWRRRSACGDTVRKDLGTLSSALRTANALWGINSVNPVTVARNILGVTKTLAPSVKRIRRVTDAEIAAIIAASRSKRLPWVIMLALETGLRRGEIAALRPAHITNGILLIKEAKTGDGQRVPLSPAAMDIIANHLTPAGLGMRADTITLAFSLAVKRAGIVDIRFHDLRHEATSRLFERGLSTQEVAIITRHADWRMLKRYTHLSPERVRDRLACQDK